MKKMLAMLGMAAALVLTGCVSTPLPPMDRRVTVAENLGYDLHVTDVRCAKGTSAYGTFQANVVNNTARELWVEWRVAWLDANGIEIDAHDLTWTSVAIAPKEVRALQDVAPRMDAADMRFYVRRMRR